MELRIRDLAKTYPDGVHALRDVTLTIPRGMFGLLGPNGADPEDNVARVPDGKE